VVASSCAALRDRATRRQPLSGEAVMFGWFQRLLPQSGDIFVLYERHSAACVAAAEALSQLVHGEGEREALIATIQDREHDADDVIREVLSEVRSTFLTPFDRNAIVGLIGAMDDTIDEIHACASAIELYDFTDFVPDMKAMASQIVGAVKLIDEALPLLRKITRSGKRLHELTGQIVSMEGAVDKMHESGLKTNFVRAQTDGDTIRFIVEREIFKHLEKISDAFEDVANSIDGLAVDHA
jgi:predicted phosphate transport protein (TIGR00153 family)